MKYGLIGEKLTHSFSPEIHSKIGSYEYELKELKKEDLAGFMTERNFVGINVTIPYKQDVIPYLDEVSDEARAIGAVNTVVNKNGRLYGYNTDCFGLKSLILKITNGKKLSGKVLILGTGGTSLTAVTVAKDLGADEVIRVSRSAKEGAITYDEALSKHTDASFIVNCTPIGMYPNDFESPISLDAFTALTGVADAVYNPLRTPLIRRARELDVPCEGGLYMLVCQAVKAYGLFFDTEPEAELYQHIYASLLKEKENIVLIGMPSSGKSSIGQRLCELLGRKFYDVDEEIVKDNSMNIPEIFLRHGESFFRYLETKAVTKLAGGITGAVIATGGGAILRGENIDMLKANGRVFFIDRDLDKLMPTSDRPLSSDIEKLTRRYNDRYPIYNAVCDERIPANGSVDEVAEAIINSIKADL